MYPCLKPLLFLLFAGLVSQAPADMFKCKDENGKVTYQGSPCPDTANSEDIDLGNASFVEGNKEPEEQAPVNIWDALNGNVGGYEAISEEQRRKQEEEKREIQLEAKKRECQRIKRNYHQALENKRKKDKRAFENCMLNSRGNCNRPDEGAGGSNGSIDWYNRRISELGCKNLGY